MKHLATPIAFLATVTSLFATPEAQWLDLQLEQISLEAQYRDKHPKMQTFRQDLATVHRELDDPDFKAYAAHASERLLELQLSEVEMLEKYREKHPKMVIIQRQIAFLETIPGAQLPVGAMEATLRELNRETVDLQVRYREKHPKIQILRAKIKFLESQLARQPTRI